MKKFNKQVKVGTKVMISGEYGYREVREVSAGRQWVKVKGIGGSHQTGHIVQYTNKNNVEMYPAFNDLYIIDQYDSVYERKGTVNMFVGKLNGRTKEQFLDDKNNLTF